MRWTCFDDSLLTPETDLRSMRVRLGTRGNKELLSSPCLGSGLYYSSVRPIIH